MRLIIFVALLMMVGRGATAADPMDAPAPFGVTWGASPEAARAQLKSLTQPASGWTDYLFDASDAFPDVAIAWAHFGKAGRLNTIRLQSRGSSDPYGLVLVKRYTALLESLRSKYGPGQSKVHIEDGYDGKYFMTGISAGLSTCAHVWPDVNGVSITLAVIYMDGELSWALSYEHRATKAAEDATIKAKEADAL